jgi:branched-chain amino acid transport system permease protein
MNGQLLLLAVVTGVGLGAVYILVALSYTLVLSTSGVFNFAQGGLVMCGAVGSYILSVRYGVPPLAALLILVPTGAVLGFLSERVAVRPFVGRSRSLTEDALVSTLGLGLVIVAVAALTFGVNEHYMPPYVSTRIQMVGPIPVRPIFLLMLVSGGAVTVAMDLVLSRTGLGAVLRAVIIDPDGAALLGIDVRKVITVSFAVAGALAVAAGFLLVPITSASIFVGDRLALLGFVAMALGGFGSFRGAIAGGIVVGLLTAVGPVVVNPLLVQPLLLVIMILVLVIRPGGFFGAAGQYGRGALREV